MFREAFRVLKPGGEFYFSDMYSDRRIPKEFGKDDELHGEGLSGSQYYNDFFRVVNRIGFTDPRLVSSFPVTIRSEEIKRKVGHISYYSAVYRLWKLENLESVREDYGQGVRYKGTILNSPQMYVLDKDHKFEKDKVTLVCGNTFVMLHDTRLAPHFEFFSTEPLIHHGVFPGCGANNPFSTNGSSSCC